MSQGINVIFGTVGWGTNPKEKNEAYVKLLQQHHITRLDTAAQYGGAEKAMSDIDASSKFVVDTKIRGFQPKSLTKEAIFTSAKTSLEDLGLDSVEVLYWHSPDPDGTPIGESLAATNQLYKEGKFKYFGLSNFTPDEVKEIHKHAQEKGYVLPTVYQGNYNPVARLYEDTLFPILRELKMAFYAYSPLAGGFLVKDAATLKKGGEGRWDPNDPIGKMYNERYNKPSLIEALSEWESIAQDAGVSKAELAYRWVRYNSILKPEYGDAIILGATREKQLEDTLTTIEKGPLDASSAKRIDQVWETVKAEAPTDNFHAP